MRASKALLWTLSLALVSAAGCGTRAPGANPAATATATPPVAASAEAGAEAVETSYERVIRKVLPSIVQITTGEGLGSGVIYDSAGHIVTNAHVVGTATTFEVTPATGGPARKATLVSAFPAGDLAVIKVDDPSGLVPATFGDSAKLQEGQIVLAMGNPLGLTGSVTQGIVSARGRTVGGQDQGGQAGAVIADAIQTSAAINPGNSGGGLVDLDAHVVGIPTLAASDPEIGGTAPGIGFAIPSNTVTDIAGQIIKNGRVLNSHRAALGVQVGTAAGRDGRPIGAQIGAVQPGGGAEKAGIKPGDVIVSVNGTATPTASALSSVLAELKPGDQCKVELLEPEGGTRTVTVTLGELPA
ncbi:trypsin-like peptidase domain-containing protein [Streptosporangiaceae bacterium NEAU-GS5]|nr:trypsin-like peptidase domain-containing protein [Streptosporangiaceae bacterium NEAU-GS5]